MPNPTTHCCVAGWFFGKIKLKKSLIAANRYPYLAASSLDGLVGQGLSANEN